jgi:AI-2 transport protein TqsA
MSEPSRTEARTAVRLLSLLAVIAAVWVLQAGAAFFVPLAFAFFLAVAVLPVARGINRRVPRWLGWLGFTVAAGIVIGFLLLFFAGIGIAARQIAGSADTIVTQVQARLVGTPLGGFVAGDGLPQLLERGGGYAGTLASGLGSTLGGLVVIFFLMLLMLLEAADWRAKLQTLSHPDGGRGWLEVTEIVGQKFRRYFLSRVALGTITGALYAGWLALFGTPLLLVWAVLALLLNFIPTFGSLIAGALPVVFVLAQQDLPTALLAGGGLLVIEQVMGNYIDPKVTGQQLSLSPLVVLISLLLWTWLWGITGALIATPMTMLLAIICAHWNPLRPIGLLLSGETTMAALDRVMALGHRPGSGHDGTR